MKYDLDEQIACVVRELAIREKVYPKWVETGRMKPAAADRELTCMRAVLGTLQAARLAASMVAPTSPPSRPPAPLK